ncbi:MAG: AraC family transcriptional regulator [Cyanobacteria bacterium K_Offshore_surface_m2_239]|nr:AraC family transcriptional regulator [Cyanobacteria bacterium K_Offshore_surface_m2_239]
MRWGAYEHVLQSEHGETVASIAKDCGYRSVSLFSLDFQKRFHVKPSTLLRHHQTKP